MNLKSTNITKYIKLVEYGESLRPHRDWLFLLGTTVVLLLVSVVWNLWSFSKVTSGEAIGSEEGQTVTTTVPLDTVEKAFEARALEAARYRNEYQFVDPSGAAR